MLLFLGAADYHYDNETEKNQRSDKFTPPFVAGSDSILGGNVFIHGIVKGAFIFVEGGGFQCLSLRDLVDAAVVFILGVGVARVAGEISVFHRVAGTGYQMRM